MVGFRKLIESGDTLAQHRAMLDSLTELAQRWDELSGRLRDYENAERLLEALATDAEAPSLRAGFSAIGADKLRTQISGLLKKVVGLGEQVPEGLKRLLRELSGFDEQGPDSKDAGLAQWTLLDAGQAVKLAGGDLELSIDGRIVLEAGDTWRFAGDAMPDPLLRVGAGGGFSVSQGLTAPFQGGAVSLGASASSKLQLNYYFDARGSRDLFASAAATRLAQLPDPFDYLSVWDAFASTDLAGIIYDFEGTATAKASVSLASTFNIDHQTPLGLSATVGAELSLKGLYSLSFRKGAPAAGGGRQIIATLSRRRITSENFEAALGLTLDLAALAERVHALLAQAIGRWDAALEEVRPYLSPGTWLRERASAELDEAVRAMVADDSLRKALVNDLRGALGLETPSAGPELSAWLAKELSDAIEQSGAISAPAAAAQVALARLTDRLPAFARQEVRQAAAKGLQSLVEAVNRRLKKQIEDLDAAGRKALGEAIRASGGGLRTQFDDADQLLAGVRDVIASYDNLFRKIVAETADAARRRISTRLQFEEMRSREASLVVVGDLMARSDSAAAVFEALTRGRLDRLERLVLGEAVADFSLDAERSSIRRLASGASKQGYELVMLGFSISGNTLLSAKADVLTDGAGNVQVDSTAGLTRRFRGPREGREVAFADVYRLRVARELRELAPGADHKLELGVSLSHTDQHLTRGEVEGFVLALERVGLVLPGTTARAVGQFDSWTPPGRNARLVADLAARLWLSGDAAVTLLRLSDRSQGVLNEAAAVGIIRSALTALRDAGAVDLEELRAAAGVVRQVYGRRYEGLGLSEVVLRFPDLWPRIEPQFPSWTGSKATERVELFKREQEKLQSLLRLIQLMGEVYEAPPGRAPGAWDAERYRAVQGQIGAASRKWLYTNQLLFWARSEVHPRTVALLCVLADLAKVARQNALTLTITHRPETGGAQTVALA